MIYSICTKCREKISTDVKVCPHCGNSITPDMFNEDNVYKVNGVDYDLTPFMDDILKDNMDIFASELRNLTDCARIMSLCDKIYFYKAEAPRELTGPTLKEMKERLKNDVLNLPKCPTCGSFKVREIGFGERSLSVSLLGLRSNKINKTFECKDCGYTW